MVLSIEMDNKGRTLTTSQNSDLIFEYLLNFKNLEMFIEQRLVINANNSEIINRFSFLFKKENDHIDVVKIHQENEKLDKYENENEDSSLKLNHCLSETFELCEEEILKTYPEETKVLKI